MPLKWTFHLPYLHWFENFTTFSSAILESCTINELLSPSLLLRTKPLFNYLIIFFLKEKLQVLYNILKFDKLGNIFLLHILLTYSWAISASVLKDELIMLRIYEWFRSLTNIISEWFRLYCSANLSWVFIDRCTIS